MRLLLHRREHLEPLLEPAAPPVPGFATKLLRPPPQMDQVQGAPLLEAGDPLREQHPLKEQQGVPEPPNPEQPRGPPLLALALLSTARVTRTARMLCKARVLCTARVVSMRTLAPAYGSVCRCYRSSLSDSCGSGHGHHLAFGTLYILAHGRALRSYSHHSLDSSRHLRSGHLKGPRSRSAQLRSISGASSRRCFSSTCERVIMSRRARRRRSSAGPHNSALTSLTH